MVHDAMTSHNENNGRCWDIATCEPLDATLSAEFDFLDATSGTSGSHRWMQMVPFDSSYEISCYCMFYVDLTRVSEIIVQNPQFQ